MLSLKTSLIILALSTLVLFIISCGSDEGTPVESEPESEFAGFEQHIITGSTFGMNEICCGDFDNDYDSDFLVTDGNATNWWENVGGGEFTEHAFSSYLRDVHCNDINNDGNIDVIGTYSFNPMLNSGCSLWLNDGTGNFSEIRISESGYRISCLKDIDNNGYPDLIISNGYYDIDLRWLTCDENLNFSAHSLSIDSAKVINACAEDLDADNDNDFIVGCGTPYPMDETESGSNFHWVENEGDGDAFIVHDIQLDENADVYRSKFRIADIDQDGNMDVICYYSYDGLFILNNEGNMSFSVEWLGISGRWENVCVFDLGDDGLLDLVALSSNHDIFLFLQTNAFEFETTEITDHPLDLTFYDLDIGDIDSDGDIDVVAGGYDGLVWFEQIWE